MTLVRRVTQITFAVAVGALGAALVLEATEVVGPEWRDDLAAGLARVAFPGWAPWISTLAGLGAAILGVALIVAQLAPPKKGLRTMHEVYRGSDGDTRIRGRAAIAAARHEVAAIEGVVAVDATVANNTMTVDAQVDDRADVAMVEAAIRDRLDHEFWINLGLADFAVNLLITHHPRPPRVR
ncbi:MAG: hypothetical protein U5R31_13365 [Acidimicrobiia bacterium]|nr:hypothetical protein [Acidimicrobiia bacterium]